MSSEANGDQSQATPIVADSKTKDAKSSKEAGSIRKARNFVRRHGIFIVVLAFAALLRFWPPVGDSLWLDEVLSVNICRGGLGNVFRMSSMESTSNLYPPLYHLVLYSWMRVFGQSDPALRSLSAVFGTLCVLAIYVLGSELFNRKTGLIAGLLLAVSPFAIFYSQEVRPYSLLMFLALASFLFFTRLLNADRKHRIDLIAYCIANVLLIYTHVFGLLAIASQVLYLLTFGKRYPQSRRLLWLAQLITLLAACPWLYFLGKGVVTGSAMGAFQHVPDPGIGIISGVLGDILGFSAGSFAFLLVPLCLVLFFCGLVTIRKQRVSILAVKPRTALLLMWFLVTLVGIITFNLVFQSYWWSKYVIGGIPALYLLVSRGADNVDMVAKTYVRRLNVGYILTGCVVMLCLPQVLGMHVYPLREQHRQVAELIEQEGERHDVVFYLSGYSQVLNHYYKGNLDVVSYGARQGEDELTPLIDGATEGKERLWLVMMQYRDTIDAPIKGYLLSRYGNDAIDSQRDFKCITVYLFRLQPEP